MSNENNEQPTTAEGAKGPKQVKHRDVRIAELRDEKIPEAEARVQKLRDQLAALEADAANEAAIADLSDGAEVSYVYGRAANKRIVSGVVRAVSVNDKGITQLKVESGAGFDAEFHIIDSSALLMDEAQVEAAELLLQEEAEARAAQKGKNDE